MSNIPDHLPTIGSALQIREMVVEELPRVAEEFRQAERRRLQLIGLASAIGLSNREIAKLTDEPPSSVANWARKVLAEHDGTGVEDASR